MAYLAANRDSVAVCCPFVVLPVARFHTLPHSVRVGHSHRRPVLARSGGTIPHPSGLHKFCAKTLATEGGGVIFSGDLFFLGVVRAVGVRVWRFCFCFGLGMVQAQKTRHGAGCLVWAVVVFCFTGS